MEATRVEREAMDVGGYRNCLKSAAPTRTTLEAGYGLTFAERGIDVYFLNRILPGSD